MNLGDAVRIGLIGAVFAFISLFLAEMGDLAIVSVGSDAEGLINTTQDVLTTMASVLAVLGLIVILAPGIKELYKISKSTGN